MDGGEEGRKEGVEKGDKLTKEEAREAKSITLVQIGMIDETCSHQVSLMSVEDMRAEEQLFWK